MNLFEVDGYVSDGPTFWGSFYGKPGIPEPYLWISAQCGNLQYRVKWFLPCFDITAPPNTLLNREDLVFENYKIYLSRASASHAEEETVVSEKGCD